MASNAQVTITAKSFGKNGVPDQTDVGAKATFKKRINGTALSLSLTDATFKDQGQTLKDVVLTAERQLSDNVKGSLTYDFGGSTGSGSLSVDKVVNGSILTLKGTYKQKDDAFILEETWRLDKRSKLSGSYNFRTEEAAATYTLTEGPNTAAASYNFLRREPKLSVSRREGRHTLEAVWEPKKEAGTLNWTYQPLKATLKTRVDRNGVAAKEASLTVNQEFSF